MIRPFSRGRVRVLTTGAAAVAAAGGLGRARFPRHGGAGVV